MSQLHCPACGNDWTGAYNCDHRCTTCGSILHGGDGLREQLADRVEDLESENAALRKECAEIRRQMVSMRGF